MGAWVLGVTGAVGAGKSSLCRMLAEHGFAVLDIDDVAADALVQVQPFLQQRIPGAVAQDGSIDKGRIFAAMLGDPELGRELEQALRPWVWQQAQRWVAGLSGPGVLDAALLFEAGLDALCDATLCVTCPREERRRRVQLRPTASSRFFDALDRRQWPESEKRARAGAAVSSEAPTQHFEAQVREALRALGRPL